MNLIQAINGKIIQINDCTKAESFKRLSGFKWNPTLKKSLVLKYENWMI